MRDRSFEHGAAGGCAIATSIFIILLAVGYISMNWREGVALVAFPTVGLYAIISGLVWFGEWRTNSRPQAGKEKEGK